MDHPPHIGPRCMQTRVSTTSPFCGEIVASLLAAQSGLSCSSRINLFQFLRFISSRYKPKNTSFWGTHIWWKNALDGFSCFFFLFWHSVLNPFNVTLTFYGSQTSYLWGVQPHRASLKGAQTYLSIPLSCLVSWMVEMFIPWPPERLSCRFCTCLVSPQNSGNR